MKTRFTLIPALALLAGMPAFAQMPAAGEGPLVNPMVAQTSIVTRAEVRAEAAVQPPVTGELSVIAHDDAPSTKTRAEVRAETREAIARGHHMAVGELS